jgi:hypothetical protein
MLKTIIILVSLVLVLHGLIHLLGTASYLKLATVPGLPYKTTVLAGQWDLGERGSAVYGLLWAVAALGFMLVPLAFWVGWGWWQSLLVAMTVLSLLLTALDWPVAFMGVIVNIVILVVLGLGPLLLAPFVR